jgi:hypothetical protein
MADKRISELPSIGTVTNDSLLYCVDQNGESRAVTVQKFNEYVRRAPGIVSRNLPGRGCLVGWLASGYNVYGTSNFFLFGFSSITYNDGMPAWDAGAPSKFFVPANVSRVRLSCSATFSTPFSGIQQLFCRKNGNPVGTDGLVGLIKNSVTSQGPTFFGETGPLDVSEGDYFQWFLYANSTAGPVVLTPGQHSWAQMEILEGRS